MLEAVTNKASELASDLAKAVANAPFKLEVTLRSAMRPYQLEREIEAARRDLAAKGKSHDGHDSYSFGYLTWQLLFLILSVCFEFLIWLVLWYRTQPVTGQDLLLVALGISFPWIAYRYFVGIFQLFEDRIVIAPDWALAWKEYGATIEINRAKAPDTPSTIHVSRYSATCPICGWMVKLERGEPTHPKRIVGRCEENPREHVFSFDRATKQGGKLE